MSSFSSGDQVVSAVRRISASRHGLRLHGARRRLASGRPMNSLQIQSYRVRRPFRSSSRDAAAKTSTTPQLVNWALTDVGSAPFCTGRKMRILRSIWRTKLPTAAPYREKRLRRLPPSAVRTVSLSRVSRIWEFRRTEPETIGNSALEFATNGNAETFCDRRKSAVGGHFWPGARIFSKPGTGWLPKEDSNLTFPLENTLLKLR